jgi:hypothetical protein
MATPRTDAGANPPAGRAALLVAHPGHELRVHGWLEQARPLVCVLTDGSGRGGRPRLAGTTGVLRAAGARPARLYGAFADTAVYAALLARDDAFFIRLAERLAAELLRERVDHVAGDAAEGYNSGHDAWRLVIDAAVALARRHSGRPVGNYEFALVGPAPSGGRSLRLDLDGLRLARKLAAARAYPEMRDEVERALRVEGEAAQAHECLRPVATEGAGPARRRAAVLRAARPRPGRGGSVPPGRRLPRACGASGRRPAAVGGRG